MHFDAVALNTLADSERQLSGGCKVGVKVDARWVGIESGLPTK